MTRLQFNLVAVAGTLVLLGVAPCAQIQNNIRRAERDIRKTTPVGKIRVAPEKIVKGLVKFTEVFKKSLDHPAATELTPEQEYYLGRTVCAQVLAERFDNKVVAIEGTGRKARGSDDLHYLQAIAAALVPAAERSHPEGLAKERIPTTLRVAVVPGEAPNAYSTPGGFVVVTSGMLSLARSEEELAAVLAHELAHVTLAHGLSAIDRNEGSLLKKIGQGAAAAGADLGLDLSQLTEAFDRFTGAITGQLTRGYDADYEFAADARAAAILEEAGYDPAALPKVVNHLDGWLTAHGKAGFGKTHPSPAERIKRLGEVPSVPGGDRHQKVRDQRFAAHTPKLVSQGAKVARR